MATTPNALDWPTEVAGPSIPFDVAKFVWVYELLWFEAGPIAARTWRDFPIDDFIVDRI